MLQTSLIEFTKGYFDRNIPVKDLKDHTGKPLNKILAYWRRHNLLPFIPEGKKARINFPQLIWIRILDDLRKISFPLIKMQLVCDYFFKDAYHDNLPKRNMEANRAELLKRKEISGLSPEEEEMLSIMEIGLSDEKLQYAYKLDVNYLSNYIHTCIQKEVEGSIYILFDGAVAEFVGDKFFGHKEVPADFNESHIRLTISSYLKGIINDSEISNLLLPQILNEDELYVLREMRRKNIKEINIYRKNDKSNWKIETVKDGILTDADAKRIKEALGLKNYEAIEIKTMDDKSLYFKLKNKKNGSGDPRPK